MSNAFIKSPQRVFLFIGLVFGLIFIFLTPPFLAPDEWNHFRRAYYTTEGGLKAHKLPDGSDAGGMVPEGVLIVESLALLNLPCTTGIIQMLPEFDKEFFNDQYVSRLKFSGENIISLFGMRTTRSVPFFAEKLFAPFPNVAVYLPHLYMPQAAGIVFGRVLGLPVIEQMYLGRFSNLLVWLCAIFLAIRLIPFLKWALVLFALTPVSLFQSSSLSPDALTNGLSILLIAVFLNYAYDESKGPAMLAAIFPLSMLVCASKLYFPLVLLYLLIPVRRVGSRKKYWGIFLLLAAAAALAVLFWYYYARGIYVPMKKGVSPMGQLQYILRDPFNYVAVLWNSIMLYGKDCIVSFVGKLGHYNHAVLPAWLVALQIMALLFISATDGNESLAVGYKEKLVLFAVLLLGVLWVFTSQYLSWTAVGANAIFGLSGRYFIPVIFLFFMLFYNRKFLPGRSGDAFHAGIACYIVCVLAFSSYTILKGYYY